jgi:hypothetical protein
MHTRQKPSPKELHKRLSEAAAAMESGQRAIADSRHDRHKTAIALEAFDLDESGFWQLIYECIQIALEDPKGCYRQPFPAKSTKSKEAKNLYMWAFSVFHDERELQIYFKFCLKKQADGLHYLHISCHESN